jgi:hypothetical protein
VSFAAKGTARPDLLKIDVELLRDIHKSRAR